MTVATIARDLSTCRALAREISEVALPVHVRGAKKLAALCSLDGREEWRSLFRACSFDCVERRVASIASFLSKIKRATRKKETSLSSADHLWNNPFVQQCLLQLRVSKRDIEVTVEDPALLERLMDRVIDQWEALGRTEPFWSNATTENNRTINLNEKNIAEFYKSGEDWMNILGAFESRAGIKIKRGLCVELGAGVGKHTHSLARRFDRVIAVDVSQSLLSINAQRMKSFGLNNVTTMLLKRPDDLAQLQSIDFFMAQSVLELNPPPIQWIMVDRAIGQLNPGGVAFLQICDWLEGYSFASKAFLDSAQDVMCDAHCFPKADVLALLRSRGLDLLDFAADFNGDSFGVYSLLAQKTRIAAPLA